MKKKWSINNDIYLNIQVHSESKNSGMWLEIVSSSPALILIIISVVTCLVKLRNTCYNQSWIWALGISILITFRTTMSWSMRSRLLWYVGYAIGISPLNRRIIVRIESSSSVWTRKVQTVMVSPLPSITAYLFNLCYA